MVPILLTTYGTVFIAEIVGDKLLYTTGVLATRYRTAPIILGITVAFMAKMAVAVLVGKAISTLPPLLVAAITAVNFFAIALVLWRRPDRREVRKVGSPRLPRGHGFLRGHLFLGMGRHRPGHSRHIVGAVRRAPSSGSGRWPRW